MAVAVPIRWLAGLDLGGAAGRLNSASGECMDTEKRKHLGSLPREQAPWPVMGMPRRVRVKGMQEVDAMVVVTVVRDRVWLSISPPFTWEAIMAPGTVDEVISVLRLAREEASKVATTRQGNAFRGDTAVNSGEHASLTDPSHPAEKL
jgi:hypothetical protein